MKAGGWIPIDKRFRYTLPKDRPYTALEAYLSFAIDIDEGRTWSINGYAALWRWSRNKVRRFVTDLRNERTGAGHLLDNEGTGKRQEIRFVFSDLEGARDSLRTGTGQASDRHEYTTKDPDPDTDPKRKKFVPPTLEDVAAYCLERGNNVVPEQWLDHYQSNGWKVGRTRMVDWKAAVRKWERNDKPRGNANPSLFSGLSNIRHDTGIDAEGRF